jgi:hypothetical protein
VPAVRKSIGGVLGPELTHIGPIVIDTSAEILASQETFIFDEVDPVTLVSLNTDGNFVFVDVAASDDGTFGKSLSIDAYFLWTPEQALASGSRRCTDPPRRTILSPRGGSWC